MCNERRPVALMRSCERFARIVGCWLVRFDKLTENGVAKDNFVRLCQVSCHFCHFVNLGDGPQAGRQIQITMFKAGGTGRGRNESRSSSSGTRA